jgi:hypothetical protein
MATSVKMAVFWDVAPCVWERLTDVSEVLTASIIIALMMETVSTSEPSVSIYQTTWRNIPEDTHLQKFL